MKYFVNLTNGIEALPGLEPGWAAVRIPSTHVEKDNWEDLFLELDANLLFWLSRGRKCCIVDYGCRREVGKVVGVAVPAIRDVLLFCWLEPYRNWPELSLRLIRRLLLRPVTRRAQAVKRKLTYYRKILDTSDVRLCGRSFRTEHDGDMRFYRGFLDSVLGE